MAKLEQYTFESLSATPDTGDDFIILENEKGELLFDQLDLVNIDIQGAFVQLVGRAMLSGAEFTVRMSTKAEDGFLTLSYPDA